MLPSSLILGIELVAVEPIEYFLRASSEINQNPLIFQGSLTSKVPMCPNFILLIISRIKIVDHSRNLEYPAIYLILKKVEVDVFAISEADAFPILEYSLHELLKILITKLIKIIVIL